MNGVGRGRRAPPPLLAAQLQGQQGMQGPHPFAEGTPPAPNPDLEPAAGLTPPSLRP